MLTISQSVYLQIRQHAEAAYPAECCGVLLGTVSRDGKFIHQAIPTDNVSENRRSHYRIDPREVIRIVRDAQTSGQEIAGFYHSHPDQAAHWSRTDLAEAHWIGCCCLIVSVERGSAASANCFRLAGSCEEDKRFEAEELKVLPAGH